MLRRAHLGPVVSVLLIACGPARSTTSPPISDIALQAPTTPLPSGFSEVELVLGAGKADFPAVQTAIRRRLDEVARCFQVARDVDPRLAGTLDFNVLFEGGRASTVEVGGTLAAAPASACARDVFMKTPPPGELQGFRYVLALAPRRTSKSDDAGLAHVAPGDLDVVSVSGRIDETARKQLTDELRACLTAPTREPVWIVARVDQGQATILPPPARKPATTGVADYCVATRLTRAVHAWPGVSFVSFAGESGQVEGDDDESPTGDAHEARRKAIEAAQEAGIIGLLGTGEPPAQLGGNDAPTNVWGGPDSPGTGYGGLGLSGIGEGGGGRGEGIGLGGIGTIGHGAGTGTGQGFGSGHGRLGGSHRTKPPSVRMGATSVSGRLPPEVIQRIVRQNFGRFRLCYENVLRNEPKAEGKVSIAFTIARDGSVSKVKGTGEGWKKGNPVACVQKAFQGLSFPQPEAGEVKVVYPISFSPGDGGAATADKAATPPPPAPAPKKKVIDGHTFAELDGPRIAKAFTDVGYRAIAVGKPGDKREAIVFVESRRGAEAAVLRRVDGPASGNCTVSDDGVTLEIDVDARDCGELVLALDVGER